MGSQTASRKISCSPVLWACTNSHKPIRTFELVAAYFALTVAVLSQVLYAIHFYKPHFQSDDAVLSMLAESMWNQGALFPKGWITNNGDLMVPSGALLMAPLLSWIPNGFYLHAIAGVFAIVVMLAAFFWFLRQRRLDTPILVIATALCASGISWYCAQVIYQQTTYLWWPGGFFIGATLIWKRHQILELPAEVRWIGATLFLVVSVICFANPARTLIMLLLPLYAFDRAMAAPSGANRNGICVRWLDRFGLRDWFVLSGLGGAFLVAAALYAALMFTGFVTTDHTASRLQWAGWEGAGKNVVLFLEGWFPFLGSNPAQFNLRTGFWVAALEAARFLLALWLTWVGATESLRVHRQTDAFRRALTWAFLAAFLPTFFLYVFFAPLAIDPSTMRYFTVPLFILLALAAVHAAHLPRRHGLVFPLLLAVMSVTVAFTSAQRFVFYAHQPWSDFWRISPSNPMRLAELLEREGLEWGYATWWNAGAVTVMSDGAVRVSPITLLNGGISPFPTMVQTAWYLPESWQGETFLVLDATEASAENFQALNASLGTPKRIVEATAHTVLVYDRNIMD